ncbi:DUF4232 domain-containing protein [Planosporangium thailandense]|uniref:DUF4232 domain-containing protein n=1 Tax=Planosporangium thailandense TaxID=765197 RepID=A0ABX0Y8W4_9ACTN|nr:DUF4232 domain-containing protein [Planosporangium thailandense]NJC73838.1 DUF4232 domain-containing protein [Planosporangium thailandense]
MPDQFATMLTGIAKAAEEVSPMRASSVIRRRGDQRRNRQRAAVGALAAVAVGATIATGSVLGMHRTANNLPAILPSVTAGPTATPDTTATAAPSATPTSGPSSTGSGQADAGTATSATPDRCHTGDLRGDFHQFEWPGHAGSESDAELGLTNISGRTCVIYGYPGIQLIGADGQPRTTTVVRSKSQPSRSVTLAPGATAWALVVSVFTPSPDEADTNPLCGGPVNQIKVIPPDETSQLTINAQVGTVCAHGELIVAPFQATRPSDNPPTPSGS